MRGGEASPNGGKTLSYFLTSAEGDVSGVIASPEREGCFFSLVTRTLLEHEYRRRYAWGESEPNETEGLVLPVSGKKNLNTGGILGAGVCMGAQIRTDSPSDKILTPVF